MMRHNGQTNQQNGGRHHSNAELVNSSVATSAAMHNEIPLASNSTHLTVPSFTSSVTTPHFHQNSGIQIKDSEIV